MFKLNFALRRKRLEVKRASLSNGAANKSLQRSAKQLFSSRETFVVFWFRPRSLNSRVMPLFFKSKLHFGLQRKPDCFIIRTEYVEVAGAKQNAKEINHYR